MVSQEADQHSDEDALASAEDDDLGLLSKRIGYEFNNAELLRRALAHRSWCSEMGGVESNERLEFLGDAVLGWAVADIVYRGYDDLPEGQLTDLRKSVVNASALAEVARSIDLGRHILLGRGEAAAGGADKPSILSDALEALLGAVYVDGGPDMAHQMVERLIGPMMPADLEALSQFDQKTRLQELSAQVGRGVPLYEATSTGPDHEKSFVATVSVDGELLGRGEGRSKKAAEQLAAAEACSTFQ